MTTAFSVVQENGRWLLWHTHKGQKLGTEPALTVELERALIVGSCLCKVRHLYPIEGIVELLVAAGVVKRVVAVEEKP
jgi:hypothetical protein